MSWVFHRGDGTESVRGPQKRAESEQEVRFETESVPKEPEAKKLDISPLQATILLAQRGRKEILPKLREALDNSPELWRHFGSLTLQAQASWIHLIAGKDLYLAEALRCHLDSMREDLAGPNASSLERLMVDRILACHVQVLYFEAHEAQNPGGRNPKLDQYLLTRQDQAHRQFLSAVKTLATVRQLAARTIQVELIHTPVGQACTKPIIASPANGDQPGMDNVQTTEPKKMPVNGVNRINGMGMNGHQNRFGSVLEPATAK